MYFFFTKQNVTKDNFIFHFVPYRRAQNYYEVKDNSVSLFRKDRDSFTSDYEHGGVEFIAVRRNTSAALQTMYRQNTHYSK